MIGKFDDNRRTRRIDWRADRRAEGRSGLVEGTTDRRCIAGRACNGLDVTPLRPAHRRRITPMGLFRTISTEICGHILSGFKHTHREGHNESAFIHKPVRRSIATDPTGTATISVIPAFLSRPSDVLQLLAYAITRSNSASRIVSAFFANVCFNRSEFLLLLCAEKDK